VRAKPHPYDRSPSPQPPSPQSNGGGGGRRLRFTEGGGASGDGGSSGSLTSSSPYSRGGGRLEVSDPLAFARLKIRQAVTNLSDSHSWHLTHHGLPPEAEQRRGDQSAPFFGSDDKEIREFITANFSAQLKRADIGRHLGMARAL